MNESLPVNWKPPVNPVSMCDEVVEVSLPPPAAVRYPVHVGASLGEARRAWLAPFVAAGQAVLVTDTGVAQAGWADAVAAELGLAELPTRRLVVPAGERHKRPETVVTLIRQALQAGVDRHACWIALGGGVVGDLVGLAASLFLRGTAVVHLPTTLLAMVDAAVGGKTGVDVPEGKNLLGTFHQPLAVLADVQHLRTLPLAEVSHGLAEVLKHGWIADAALLAEVEDLPGPRVLREDAGRAAALVARAVAVKVRIVTADERERGPRMLLNFGHTVGHALEAATDYALPHGAAVAVGMVAETRLAQMLGECADATATDRLLAVLPKLGLPTTASARWIEATLRHLAVDKKRAAGRLRMALPVVPGQARMVEDVPRDTVEAVLRTMWLN